MQLPPSTTPSWNSLGYSQVTHLQSYQTVIDAFVAAFPSKNLDLEVHPVLENIVGTSNKDYVHLVFVLI